MRRYLPLLLLVSPLAAAAQTTPAPADSARPAPARTDTTRPADPAAYLRVQQPGAVPANAAPGLTQPAGTVQLEAAQNQQVLTPTGFQNSQGVGTNVTFRPKQKPKRRRDD